MNKKNTDVLSNSIIEEREYIENEILVKEIRRIQSFVVLEVREVNSRSMMHRNIVTNGVVTKYSKDNENWVLSDHQSIEMDSSISRNLILDPNESLYSELSFHQELFGCFLGAIVDQDTQKVQESSYYWYPHLNKFRVMIKTSFINNFESMVFDKIVDESSICDYFLAMVVENRRDFSN